jgi:hypothetical protein
MVALVDDEDFGYLNLFKWYAKKSGKNDGESWYAVRMERLCEYSMRGRKGRKRKKRKTIRMHNVIMSPKDDEIVHHKENLENVLIIENRRLAAAKTNNQKQDEVPF